jgi:quercetin dioxygenase-like cupin family protein
MKKTAIEKQQDLANPPLVMELAPLFAQLREKEEWHSVGRSAITLMKTPFRRVTLMAMRAGAELSRHRTRGEVLLHVLSGRIRFGADDARVEVGAGSLVTLDPRIPHDVEALEESDLLLMVVKEEGDAEDDAPETPAGSEG